MKQVDILRVIDANFNRVREAIRVIEDIVRFSNSETTIAKELRKIRHSFTLTYMKFFDSIPIIRRDVFSDTGKDNKPFSATSVKQILLRNFLRAEEGLRCIEECSIIVCPLSTSFWQKIRFQLYHLEQTLMKKIPDKSLSKPFLGILIPEIALENLQNELAILVNADPDFIILTPAENIRKFIKCVKKLKRFMKDIMIFVCDRPDIALIEEIDGIHFQSNYILLEDITKILGGKIIGIEVEKAKDIKKLHGYPIAYFAFRNYEKISRLLTKREKNSKLCSAVINSCHEIKKAMKSGASGVIIRYNITEKTLITETCKTFRTLYGKKT